MSEAVPLAPPSRPARATVVFWLASLVGGTLVAGALCLAIVRYYDPLLFFGTKAGETQPLFYLAREGNFSRYVYPGLMRNLPYQVLWVGPSYAAPLVRGADPRQELMVTMGNMSGWELLHVLRLESRLHKAATVNVVVSPRHFTEEFRPANNQSLFPRELWGPAGAFRYQFDPYMVRLGFSYLAGTPAPAVDLLSAPERQRINESYFWMHDEPKALRDYWHEYRAKFATQQALIRLRDNLRKEAALGTGAPPPKLGPEVEELLRDFFLELTAPGLRDRVQLVFPPRHLSAWGTEFEPYRQQREIKRRIVEFAQGAGVRVFDFEADEAYVWDRTRHYDPAHFSEKGVAKLRAEIFSGRPVRRDVNAVLEKFSRTSDADDAAMLAALPD